MLEFDYVWIVHKSDVIYGVFKIEEEAEDLRKALQYDRELSGCIMLEASVYKTRMMLR